ncbi:MAG TPA: S1 RNA-binding domain-containing protein, partial [Gammaproteobacteria bacterium]|nr:S1 RNA-binding domain-containing protein [Gammaproteobacteria bacterium]
ELNEIYVEGLVHITSLPRDYYHFDPIGHRLSGERSHRIYRLGDKLRVKIARVDLDERRIDLEPVEARSVRGKGRRALLKKKRA